MSSWQSVSARVAEQPQEGAYPASPSPTPPPPQKGKGALPSGLFPPGSVAHRPSASQTDWASLLCLPGLGTAGSLGNKTLLIAEELELLFLNPGSAPKPKCGWGQWRRWRHRPPWPAAIFLPHLLPQQPLHRGEPPPQPQRSCLPLSGPSLKLPVNGFPHPCILLRILECQSWRGPQ